jgi:organic radical activating enzyme
MHYIKNKVDFYITNVCNLTCERCNRFNNYNFRGWQAWQDYKSDYEQWSKFVDLRAATIMGGEPFLNPTLGDWIDGINSLFGIEVQVLTNGTRFQQSKHLYKHFLYQSEKNNQCKNHIGVSLHRLDQYDQLKEDVLDFLEHPVQIYPKDHPNNLWKSDLLFVDCNNIFVNVYIVDKFGAAAIKPLTQTHNRFELHNSNPEIAHGNCAFVQFKSYHFIRGKLYKCGPAALMPEFDQQHQFNITDEDREILHSYKALDVDNFVEYYREFFGNIDNPIPQCKFCPESYDSQKIFPIKKGKDKSDS